MYWELHSFISDPLAMNWLAKGHHECLLEQECHKDKAALTKKLLFGR